MKGKTKEREKESRGRKKGKGERKKREKKGSERKKVLQRGSNLRLRPSIHLKVESHIPYIIANLDIDDLIVAVLVPPLNYVATAMFVQYFHVLIVCVKILSNIISLRLCVKKYYFLILYLIYSQCYFWVHDPLNILPYSTVVIQRCVGGH